MLYLAAVQGYEGYERQGGKATSGRMSMSYVSPEGRLRPLRYRMSMGSRSRCSKYGRNPQRGSELGASDELRIYLLDNVSTKYSNERNALGRWVTAEPGPGASVDNAYEHRSIRHPVRGRTIATQNGFSYLWGASLLALE